MINIRKFMTFCKSISNQVNNDQIREILIDSKNLLNSILNQLTKIIAELFL